MNSGTVDAAVVGLLAADATLQTLCPDGVYFSTARHGATRFVLVALTDHEELPMFAGAEAYERFDYLIKAVILNTSGSTAQSAATQIDALLREAETTLAPVGYQVANIARLAYRRYTEPGVDPDQQWQHHGAEYEVLVTPT
jgi:hypothetical protein